MDFALLSSLLDELPLGVVLLDSAGRIALYNRYEEQLAHRSRESVLGQDFFATVAPCMNVGPLGDRFRHAIGKEPFASEVEFSFRFPHLLLPLDVKVRLTSLEVEGRSYGCLFVEDLSSQRSQERLKETLNSLLIHDLKNPLAVMLSGLSFLGGLPPLKDDQDAVETIEDGLTAGRRLQRMLLDLMDISRAEGGALPLQRRESDLRDLVSTVVREAKGLARSRSITLVAEVPEGAVLATVDAGVLRRALDNLIENALRYSRTSGRIRVGASGSPTEVTLSVTDEGPGIPAHQRERIFEKFGQVEGGANAETGMNRGLGLTFVRLAARAHGGEAAVECPPTGGTTFRLTLPRT